jgi:glycosyltransferase involved in cell wall biosynthesis
VRPLGSPKPKPKIVCVTPVVPGLDAPNGFGVRIFHLLDALAEVARIDVFLWGWTEIDAANPVVKRWREQRHITLHRATNVGRPPIYEQSPLGRVRRLFQYTLARLPVGNRPRRARAFEAYLERGAPQLVCLHLPETAHLAFRVPRQIPVVSVLEEGLERRTLMQTVSESRRYRFAARTEALRARRLYRQVSRRVRAIVAISDEEAAWFRSADVEPDRLIVLPHGVDTEYFSAPSDEGVVDIDVAVFGNMQQPQNMTPALAVLEESRTRHKNWKWAFVGIIDRDTRDRLSDRGVIVPGYVPDIRPYYERSRIVLVPSQGHTGVKTTALQAWAMRRPLVTTPEGIRGLSAVPDDNVLVGRTASELVEHCESALASFDFRQKLAAAGRRTVTSKHDIGTISRSFTDLCLSIIAETEPR